WWKAFSIRPNPLELRRFLNRRKMAVWHLGGARRRSNYAIFEVTLFIAILLVGYFYAWGRGLLKWD
ncbi:MAG: NADH-quinone oxidoreductase subunit A, partial [Caldisericales bacterium]|nr:NADH-quinone oxidoreductase subunit A [Caldisericales bacterium]